MNRDDCTQLLDRIAAVLIRCFLLTLALLLVWFAIYQAAGDWAYGTTARLYDITRRDYTLLNCYGMAFLKLGAYLFFLIPWLAIRLVLLKDRA